MLIVQTLSTSVSTEGKQKRVERLEELEGASLQIQRRFIVE